MFEQIIGNEKIKKDLKLIANQNKNSHSYLFIGIEGIGKRQIAQEFSKMLLCLGEEKYCNKCKSCIEFDTNNNPDFMQINPDGSSIKIEQIREMQRKVIEAPIISKKKIYIIDDADTMTKEAQNCLLKTLEEPPEYACIILIASNENNILTTIKSRCTIIKFEKISDKDIKKYLKEKYEINDINDNLLQAFQGSIGKVETLKDKQDLYDSIFNIIDKIEKLNLIEILNLAEIIYQSQDDKFEILEYMNVILFNKGKENIKYLKCINIVEDTKKRLKANSNYNMCIDNMLFSIWEEMN